MITRCTRSGTFMQDNAVLRRWADLLTMAELVDMVSDMRTKDVRVIGELGKYVPTFAAFEKGRLSLYREAAKEAEEIMQRWDDDFEPDEYFAD